MPLGPHMGWVMPTGAEGWCEHDESPRLTFVEFDGAALRELGLDPR